MNFQTEKSKLYDTITNFFIEPQEQTKLQRVLNSLNLSKDPATEIAKIIQFLGDNKVVLAGGAMTSLFTGKNINDLDFYLEDRTKLAVVQEFLYSYFKEPPFVSANCITFKRKGRGRKVWTVQLITRFSGNPYDVFKNFDFTITTGAYRFWDADFYFGDRFFPDISARKLVFMGASEYPICALWRTKKYQARGYDCPGSTIMHIGLAIVRLQIETYGELKKQLLGIDTIYLQKLLEREEYADGLPVDYGKFVADALHYMNVHHEEDDEKS